MKKAILFNDTSNEMHHGCNLVIYAIKKLLIKNNIQLIYSIFSGTDWRKDKLLLKKIKKEKIDLLVVNGEGTIHHDQYYAKILIQVSELAQKYNIKSVLINCTYDSNDPSQKKLLKNFNIISVREKKSKEDLEGIGVNAIVVPDLSFYYFQNIQLIHKHKRSLFVSDSVLSDYSQSLFMFAAKNNYKFVPILSFYRLKIFNPKSWMGFFKFLLVTLYLKLTINKSETIFFKNLYRFQGKYFTRTYVNLINSNKFLITGRYHDVCIAIMCRTPFVSIKSNTFKIQELLNDIGINKNRVANDISSINNIMRDRKISYFDDFEIANIYKFLFSSKKTIEDLFLKIRNEI
ncbi:polysaccharide pyruvyl transferase family protein [Pelagibacteraceae bacterium]|nr:polysaccharide pyruvyl transferase family protein [Pelagibacteraceae bacterium]